MRNIFLPKISHVITSNGPIFLSLLIIFSAVFYYFFNLKIFSVVIIWLITIFSLILYKKLQKKYEIDSNQSFFQIEKGGVLERKDWLLLAGFFLFTSAALLELWLGRSARPLISPWEVVNKSFFFFYLLSLFIAILIIAKKNIGTNIKLLLISFQYLLGLSVALVVYRLGYGFDPFIHQAALEVIDKQGFIAPKTLYYLGQYGLIISLHKILGISLAFLNSSLVPLMSAILLPVASYRFFKQIPVKTTNDSQHEKSALLATIILLAFSWPLFIISTPQNFSYLFIILAIINGLIEKWPFKTVLFSLAAAAIHPLTGIPAIIWSAWLVFKQLPLSNKKTKNISAAILSAGAVLLPAALVINGGTRFKLSLGSFFEPLRKVWQFSSAGQEDWLLNLIYFIYHNQAIIITSLVIIGLILFHRKYQTKFPNYNLHAWRGLLSISSSLIIAFIISSQLAFSQLIAYEQSNYASRILIIIVIFFFPFLGLAIYDFTKRINNTSYRQTYWIWLVILMIFISSSLYLAYPRFDKYFNSRGYSTSQFDIEAVKFIDNNAKGDYVVLANQQVSAAALDIFGFNRYYKNNKEEIYFYPIPTGGPLYEHYLKMIYGSASRENALSAMALANVDEVFLVVNKYWLNSGKIIKEAKLSADSWSEIGKQEIFIFQYLR